MGDVLCTSEGEPGALRVSSGLSEPAKAVVGLWLQHGLDDGAFTWLGMAGV